MVYVSSFVMMLIVVVRVLLNYVIFDSVFHVVVLHVVQQSIMKVFLFLMVYDIVDSLMTYQMNS